MYYYSNFFIFARLSNLFLLLVVYGIVIKHLGRRFELSGRNRVIKRHHISICIYIHIDIIATGIGCLCVVE